MKILALDPGSESSAYTVWDGVALYEFDKIPNDELMRRIRETLRSQTGLCIIEMIGHYGKGMPAGKSVFTTCLWIGRFGERYGWDNVRLVMRASVKAHLCGTTKAKDGNVALALKDRFGIPGTVKNKGFTYGIKADTWQSFALAVTWTDTEASGVLPIVRLAQKADTESVATKG